MFKFSPATLLFVECETQDAADHCWAALSAGGRTQPCGWLDDKCGVSWQIVPNVLARMLQAPDAARASRVMQAMLKMSKIKSAPLQPALTSVEPRPLPAQHAVRTGLTCAGW